MAAPAGVLPNVGSLKEVEQSALVNALKSVTGPKDLIIDPHLMKSLDKIAGASLLKRHGVDKIYKLEAASMSTGERRMYLVRPELQAIKLIADQINADKLTGDKHRSYKLLMVPQTLCICEKLLEEEGVYGYVTIESLPLDLIPLDKDVLSLEMENFFTSYFLHEDQTMLQTVARSIAKVQRCFGSIPNVYGQGNCAKRVFELTEQIMRNESDRTSGAKHEIGHLILIDRDIDYVTSLCSQVTYEGLLDDTFGIQCGIVEFGPEVTGTDKSIKLPLNSDDKIFEEIRNKHFTSVFLHLSSRAKELQRGYDKRHNIKSVGEMKDFVSNDLMDLKQLHKSLTLHISACEVIMSKKTAGGDLEDQLRTEHSLLEGTDAKYNSSYIDECIFKCSDPVNTLRLMCLCSAVNDGLAHAMYESFKKQFLQSHGYHHLLTFFNLRRLGLLVENQPTQPSSVIVKLPTRPSFTFPSAKLALPKKSAFQAISKKLNLVPKTAAELDLKNPTDMAYVFSGAYTPLSCKLIEQILQRQGFAGLEDVVKQLQSETFTSNQATSSRQSGQTAPTPADKTVMVYFLGGVTYSEIAALRLLGRLKGYSFLVAATNMVNGNQLIQALLADS